MLSDEIRKVLEPYLIVKKQSDGICGGSWIENKITTDLLALFSKVVPEGDLATAIFDMDFGENICVPTDERGYYRIKLGSSWKIARKAIDLINERIK